MSVSVLGAGAFGTALAIAISRESDVILWARDTVHVTAMHAARMNAKRLPDAEFPARLSVTDDLENACDNDVILLAVPMQKLATFLELHHQILSKKTLVACCKGVDQATGLSAIETIETHVPDAHAAILTGPSFAADIAKGLPPALRWLVRMMSFVAICSNGCRRLRCGCIAPLTPRARRWVVPSKTSSRLPVVLRWVPGLAKVRGQL